MPPQNWFQMRKTSRYTTVRKMLIARSYLHVTSSYASVVWLIFRLKIAKYGKSKRSVIFGSVIEFTENRDGPMYWRVQYDDDDNDMLNEEDLRLVQCKIVKGAIESFWCLNLLAIGPYRVRGIAFLTQFSAWKTHLPCNLGMQYSYSKIRCELSPKHWRWSS
jgi:hypothetical protein